VNPLSLVICTCLGVLAMAAALLPIAWLASRILPGRRTAIAFITLTVLVALTACALVKGSRPPVVTHVTVSLANLPPDASGFTLVQLSDLHLGRLTRLDRLHAIVGQVNATAADLVVITGDLADADAGRDGEFCEGLKPISARHGVVAVPGNHDYAAGIERFLRLARCSNITVLRNERLSIGGAIQVAGLDEAAGRSFAEGGPNLDKALAGCDPGRPVVLLWHMPYGFDRAARKHVDLQLSGHTHGGQIPPMDLLVWLTTPYSSGFYEKGGSRLYVSDGTGTWGPPMRLFSRNEIVRFTLVRPHAARPDLGGLHQHDR